MSGLLVSGVGVIFRDLETALMVVVESECIISNQQQVNRIANFV